MCRVNLIRCSFLMTMLCGLAVTARAQAPEQATQQATLAQQPLDTVRTTTRVSYRNRLIGTPLYIVNGRIIPYEQLLKTLNPQEIEKIEILKGEAGVARYGSLGAQGAVLITTKRSK